MFQLAQLLGLRHLWNQWLRTLASLMGIIIGITTFIFGPTIANTLSASVDMTADDIAGRASLEIILKNGFTPADLSTIRAIGGIEIAVPSINGGGLLLGENELLAFWGIDPTLEREIRTYVIAQGDFIQTEGEALITQRYALDKGMRLGDTLTLVSTGGIHSLRVVGVLRDTGGVARLNSGDIVVMIQADAMRLADKSSADTVHLVLDAGASAEQVSEQLKIQFADIQVNTPASHLSNAKAIATILNMIMGIITFTMLFAGSFLIYNTVAVSVAQRRSEIGILRALGLEKQAIRRMFMAEAVIMGLVGSFLGIIGGYLMLSSISGNFEILPRELISASPLQSKATFSVAPWLPFFALSMGILFPILASYLASKEAIQIDPTEAMIQIRAETGRIPIYKRRIILGVAIIVIGIIIRLTYSGDLAVAVILSNILTYSMIFGAILLIAPLLFCLNWLMEKTNQWGWNLTSWLAGLNLTQRPKRILSTSILLVIGGMMLVYISQSNYGFTDFVDEWRQNENVGDLTVLGAGVNPLQPIVNIPQTVIEEISSRPDVVDSAAELMIGIESDGVQYKIRAIDLPAFTRMDGSFIWNEGDKSTALERLITHDKPTLLLHMGAGILTQGLDVGSIITLNTPQGEVNFEIIGTIYGSLGLDEITLVMDKALYAQLWGDTDSNKFALQLANGADIQAIRRELLAKYAMQGVVVYDVADVTQAFSDRLTSIATVSSLMSGLFTIVITVGLGSTFYVLILDRRRELGMLRALGMTKHQIRMSVLKEGILLFALTSLLTVPGAYLATSFQQLGIQNLVGFKFNLEIGQVISHLGIILILVILAVVIPAHSASKTNILEAMRYE